MIELPMNSVRYIGVPARDELRDAAQGAERGVYMAERDLVRKLDGGVRWRDLRRERRALREALAELAVVRHMGRVLDDLDADDDEVSP